MIDFDYRQSSVKFFDFKTYNYRTIIVAQLSRANLIGLQVYRGYEPCGSVNPKHRKQGVNLEFILGILAIA